METKGRCEVLIIKVAFVEVPLEERVDVHGEEDLELAKFYMEKRLKGEAIRKTDGL